MEIRPYTTADAKALFALLRREGEDWSDYWGDEGSARYAAALEGSIVLLALAEEGLCGYIRCRDDDGFGIYVCDLLVDKAHRGRQIGHALMDALCARHPGDDIYVMSDVDPYYEKQGYARVGSVFQVREGAE